MADPVERELVRVKYHLLEFKHNTPTGREPRPEEITGLELRIYERAAGKPVFMVLEKPGPGPDISTVTRALAAPLITIYEMKPDQTNWFELRKDGKIERVHFGTGTFDRNLEKKDGWGVINRTPANPNDIDQEIARGLSGIEMIERTVDLTKEVLPLLSSIGFTEDEDKSQKR